MSGDAVGPSADAASGSGGAPARDADPRPRPRYGEYATPQEQAEVVAKSLPPVSPLLVPSDQGGSVPAGTGSAPPSVPAPTRAAGPATRKRRGWDLVLSSALLAYGLLTVLSSFTFLQDPVRYVGQLNSMLGIAAYTPTPFDRPVLIAIVLVGVVVWLLAALITLRLLRAGRVAFYVPVIGGAVAALVSGILVTALVWNDPAFMAYLDGMS